MKADNIFIIERPYAVNGEQYIPKQKDEARDGHSRPDVAPCFCKGHPFIKRQHHRKKYGKYVDDKVGV